MRGGYWDRIAHVDLSKNLVEYESPGDLFFRRYLGGGGLGSFYVLKNVQPGTDAFSPENVIVFAPSVVTGAPIAGFARHSVTSVSPLTGGVLDSEAGGFWSAELKFAGIDAIVVKGQAKKPVYLWVKDGQVEIKDATHLWGKYNGEVLETVEKETGEKRVKILGIGPGGENQVSFACIISDLHDAIGRGGLGAVMGNKKLKAILVKGTQKIPYVNQERVMEISKSFAKKFKEIPGTKGLNAMGTTGGPEGNSNNSMLPTNNWTTGYFETAAQISGNLIHKTILAEKLGCYACPVRCKRMVGADAPKELDPVYAGMEYESLAALGSFLGIDDLYTVAKAIELCNKYTIDTISMGNIVGFAMDCYEAGLLTQEDTDGLELRFGNKDVLLPLIDKVVKREGFGNLLADGIKKAVEKIGPESEKYAVHCKGVDYPAHEPRVKRSLALAYSVCPVGADHMCVEHDHVIAPTAPDLFMERISPLGIYEKLPQQDLGWKKVRVVYYTMMYYSFINCLDLCMFCVAPMRALDCCEVVDAVSAITGWETSLWELMKIGERRLNMMRVFNLRAGIGPEEDKLPQKMLQPMQGGTTDGLHVEKEEFEEALQLYYGMAGWDQEGKPQKSKLLELELEWLLDE
ncbi:MAG: aldehyde ferredoxin oxidoreductase family protein [Clostridia bacterium]|nr:aldehyde ferredoxin oxidoreductase family protein [Clostridia bacterium]